MTHYASAVTALMRNHATACAIRSAVRGCFLLASSAALLLPCRTTARTSLSAAAVFGAAVSAMAGVSGAAADSNGAGTGAGAAVSTLDSVVLD